MTTICDDNDSFMEDYPFSHKEMVAFGRKHGATHLLICYDGPGSDPSPVYVYERSKLDNTIDACYGACPSVTVVDLEAADIEEALQ